MQIEGVYPSFMSFSFKYEPHVKTAGKTSSQASSKPSVWLKGSVTLAAGTELEPVLTKSVFPLQLEPREAPA